MNFVIFRTGNLLKNNVLGQEKRGQQRPKHEKHEIQKSKKNLTTWDCAPMHGMLLCLTPCIALRFNHVCFFLLHTYLKMMRTVLELLENQNAEQNGFLIISAAI